MAVAPTQVEMTFQVYKNKTNQGYEILGQDSNIVQVALGPGQKMASRSGAMNYMPTTTHMTSKCTNAGKIACCFTCASTLCFCFAPILLPCMAVVTAGKPLFIQKFQNEGAETIFVGITPDKPAKIIAVDLNEQGGKMNFMLSAYLGHTGDIELTSPCHNLMTCACGPQSSQYNVSSGTGTVFLSATGTIVAHVLKAGESIHVDGHSVVAWSPSVSYDLAANFNPVCFNEGLCLAKMVGPGTVYIQSCNEGRYFYPIRRALWNKQQEMACPCFAPCCKV